MKRLVQLAGGALAVLVAGCASDESAATAPGLQTVEVKRIAEPSGAGVRKEAETVATTPPRSAPDPPKGVVTQVDLQRVFEMQGADQMLLVDVRPTFHYNLGHIPGAIGMQKRTFESEFPARKGEFDAAVAAGKVIVFYCANDDCPDGAAAARILAKKGYSSSVYKGGWAEWKESGL